MPRGTKYLKEFDRQVYELSLLGMTDAQMSEELGVSTRTFNRWKNTHESFCQSLKEGKTIADAKVAHSLYEKALSGDVKACIHWLNNRQADRWREKQELKVDGNVTLFETKSLKDRAKENT